MKSKESQDHIDAASALKALQGDRVSKDLEGRLDANVTHEALGNLIIPSPCLRL